MIQKGKCLFTSESVGEGHPDKMCDAVSDAVLDAILAKDKAARVACETYVTRGLVVVGGEITTNTWVDIDAIAREEIKRIGYTDPKYGFNADACAILNVIGRQSPDISQGVDAGGAGDQGLMVGYAVDETPEFLPITLVLANKIVAALADARRTKKIPFIGPDCKSQITFEYIDGKPKRIDTVVVSVQHTADVLDKTGKFMTDAAKKKIIDVIVTPLTKKWTDKNAKILINPTGKFVTGGPQSDTGMTGRKIIVDTYGGRAPHGGGAFSGKDPTKVDRSAAYMARYIAKNIVAAKIAKECTVHTAYAIGKAEPVGFYIDTHGTSVVSDEKITAAARKIFPLTPRGIIEYFRLRRPIYKQTAAYGHFGRKEFPWEKIDKTGELKQALMK
ncbi:MAG: methionine adenosyltransferase [Elusimicrobium sp.]|jgi:S-adenosylmethionine synthetase|nr:methionine adenosyltransferase [Elusimicrobium sp.]